MCVAAVAWDAHPRWLLAVAGNRDEFHARPAAPLAPWTDGSDIIAGTDLTAGGTWLGVSPAGRFALVTNYRVPGGPVAGRPSRGRLVTDLLAGEEPAGMARMNAFNLVFVDAAKGRGAAFLTNHPRPQRRELAPGVHGLSNGGFDVPWSKTLRLNAALAGWLDDAARDTSPRLPAPLSPLFAALADDTPPAATGSDPDTAASPVFIRNAVYGTRCSTVVLVDRQGEGLIVERSFDAAGRATGEKCVAFGWPL